MMGFVLDGFLFAVALAVKNQACVTSVKHYSIDGHTPWLPVKDNSSIFTNQ